MVQQHYTIKNIQIVGLENRMLKDNLPNVKRGLRNPSLSTEDKVQKMGQ